MPRDENLFDDVEEGWCMMSNVWWNICWFMANFVILAPRAYIAYKEEGIPAARQFSLRGSLISFASLWFIFAVATGVTAVLSCDLGDAVNAIGVLAVEFVAICLWYHYYGNGDLMERVVNETHERMSYLLIQGLGMMITEREQFWKEAEEAIVNLWRRKLKEKQWSAFTAVDRDRLMFETGFECGKVLENQWEGVLYDVAAFFNEWRIEAEELSKHVRMTEAAVDCMKSGNDAGHQALICVAIIVANEDKHLRQSRKKNEHRTDHQFCGARIARRKTAAEGILRYPDVVEVMPRVIMHSLEMDKSGLSIFDGRRTAPCTTECPIPHSVLYTLKEIIHAGYILIPPNGNVTLSVTFKHGNMVIDKNQWNPMRTIERRPFRYINSATWMAGDVAFMVEQRELTGYASMHDGSGYLKGKLEIFFKAEEIPEEGSWVDRTSVPEAGQLWGDIDAIAAATTIYPLNRPMMWMLGSALWTITRTAAATQKINFQKTKPRSVDPKIWDTAERVRRMGVGEVLVSASERLNATRLHTAESVAINQIFHPNGELSTPRSGTENSTHGGDNNV